MRSTPVICQRPSKRLASRRPCPPEMPVIRIFLISPEMKRARSVSHARVLCHNRGPMALPLARVEGALIGTMTGDSLGARVEGVELAPLRHRYPDENALL